MAMHFDFGYLGVVVSELFSDFSVEWAFDYEMGIAD